MRQDAGFWFPGHTGATPGVALRKPLLLLALSLPLAGWWLGQPLLLWSALVPAVVLGLIDPASLVASIALTTPVFPVLRLAGDAVGAAKVSSKGLFFSADDPLILALGVAWVASRLRFPGERRDLFPGAAAGLAILYPVVIALNAIRLDTNQVIVSALYFLKWLQYASLLVLVPQTVRGADRSRLIARYLKAAYVVCLLTAGFGVYELLMSVRTQSYTKAAAFPRISSFFGSLDPNLYGASEDPVNFGVWSVLMGSVVLAAMMSGSRRHGVLRFGALLSMGFALLASASRAPVLAAAAAYSRLQKLNSSRLVLTMAALTVLGGIGFLMVPELWMRATGRFSALLEWDQAEESSAVARLQVAMNSPVFEIDQYWLIGHGHSTYRFIAEEHLARFNGGLSRSLYSFPLTAWYDGGPLGLLLWIVLFRQLGRRLRRIRDSSPDREVAALASGLCAALWALAVASMFGEVPYNWRVMGSFYLAVGVCMAADEAVNRHMAFLLLRHQAQAAGTGGITGAAIQGGPSEEDAKEVRA
ncbi:MAG: hypothetical protein R2762_15065 [Bryobacteraceae bacterium]